MCSPLVHIGLFSVRALQVCGRMAQRSERPQPSKERASFAESTPEGGAARARSWQEGGEEQVKQKPAY